MPAILDRCVKDVMAKGNDKSSSFAICTKSLGLNSLKKEANKKRKNIAPQQWKTLTEFPAYEINRNEGIRRKGKSKTLKGRTWMGYPKVTLMRDGKKNERRVHKLLAETFIPNPNNLPIVNHKDANRANFAVDNLEWVDNSGNQLHRWKTQKEGLAKKKYVREYGLSKTAEKARSFDNIPCNGLKTKENGERYGVSCGQEKKTGLKFCYTHRARSKGYKSLSDIPLGRVKFVDSSG